MGLITRVYGNDITVKKERERERCTLVDEVLEELLTGKTQGMDFLELYKENHKVNVNSTVCTTHAQKKF